MPYKREVMKYCDDISEISLATNSVNCIVRRANGSLFGTNTDYFGFRYTLESEEIIAKGKKCLVLGSGGVSGSVTKLLEDMEAGSVICISRKGVSNYENIYEHYDAEIIVNATPVGMFPNNGEVLIDIRRFTACEAVIDLIYNPLKTQFVLDAERCGIRAVGGLKMLLAQAIEARNLFLSEEANLSMETEIRALQKERENIVLIGMPGCGKTSIGKKLAELTGKSFIDSDEEIYRKTGKSPEEIIATDGKANPLNSLKEHEKDFRKIETNILQEITKKNAQVIATGGGVVEREVNRDLLRQNGTVIYLKRELSKLPVEGRPVSLSEGLKAIFERRNSLYSAWSDFEIDNDDFNTCMKGIEDWYE